MEVLACSNENTRSAGADEGSIEYTTRSGRILPRRQIVMCFPPCQVWVHYPLSRRSAPTLLRFCSDSALILLHSAVMLELAYYAEYSAGIIRIYLVWMYYSCLKLVFHLISSFVCFVPYSGAKYYLPRKLSYRRKPNFYQDNPNIQISSSACYGLTPYRQHH